MGWLVVSLSSAPFFVLLIYLLLPIKKTIQLYLHC